MTGEPEPGGAVSTELISAVPVPFLADGALDEKVSRRSTASWPE